MKLSPHLLLPITSLPHSLPVFHIRTLCNEDTQPLVCRWSMLIHCWSTVDRWFVFEPIVESIHDLYLYLPLCRISAFPFASISILALKFRKVRIEFTHCHVNVGTICRIQYRQDLSAANLSCSLVWNKTQSHTDVAISTLASILRCIPRFDRCECVSVRMCVCVLVCLFAHVYACLFGKRSPILARSLSLCLSLFLLFSLLVVVFFLSTSPPIQIYRCDLDPGDWAICERFVSTVRFLSL